MLKLNRKGFTLLELLIVIAIIAILSVIVILVLNPAETLKKARDSQRLADLNTIKTVVGLYLSSTPTPFIGQGGTTNNGCAPSGAGHFVWYSKAGITATGLDGGTGSNAQVPATQAAAGATDGTGWLPVNLNSLVGGSPISNFPVDPVNSVAALGGPLSSNDLVYRYGCSTSTGVQFEVDAALESNAYTIVDDKRASDGGNNASLYEVGTKMDILGSGAAF